MRNFYNISELTKVHDRLGVDNASKIMRLFEISDVNIGKRYLDLISVSQDKAQRYFDYIIGHKDTIKTRADILHQAKDDCLTFRAPDPVQSP